jgi:hypothetical protein
MPKKIGEKPLTKAEIMARYRAKKKAAGFHEKVQWVDSQAEQKAEERRRQEDIKTTRETNALAKAEKKIEQERKKHEAELKERRGSGIIHLLRILRLDGEGIPGQNVPKRPALLEAAEYIQSEFIPEYYPELTKQI